MMVMPYTVTNISEATWVCWALAFLLEGKKPDRAALISTIEIYNMVNRNSVPLLLK